MSKEIVFRRKLIDNRGSLMVNIPAELVEAFELIKGQEMEITVSNDVIQLQPSKK
ncbi:MAG: AbrB/MazE/SpoVT family DNA-binding domain-containing protein [Candidatus Heimdallarchaeota archaeon]